MCGRFTITMTASEIESLINQGFEINHPTVDSFPRYNIAPTQNILGILYTKDHFRIGTLKWGFQFSNHLAINSRMESIEEKTYFKDLYQTQRILLFSNGYFEWDPSSKTPYYIHYKNQEPMYFGGLWRKNKEHFEASIITLPADQTLQKIHPRMPFSMRHDQAKLWLQGSMDFKESVSVPTEVSEISKTVNSVQNNDMNIFEKNTA